MGIIVELARAKQRIKELEAKVAELQEQLPPVIVPVTDLITISRIEYLTEMQKAGISPIASGSPLDAVLSITNKLELDKIAPYLVYPADLYIAEIWDCEDYALQAQCDAGLKFHVSGVRLGLGWMPLGYHGFPVTLDKDRNIWWLEPNAGFEYAGEWKKIGDADYRPDKVFA